MAESRVDVKELFAPTSAERIARNDATFREANEDIADVAEKVGAVETIPFICECAEPTCKEIVLLSRDEYEEVRSDPRVFVNAVGHHVAAQGWAKVIAERDGYVIVRKIGRAGEVAEDLAEGNDAR